MAATLYSFAHRRALPPLESILKAYAYLTERAESLHREKGDRVWTAADVQLRLLSILWAKLNSRLQIPALQTNDEWENLRQRFFAIAGRRFEAHRQPSEREITAEALKLPADVWQMMAA